MIKAFKIYKANEKLIERQSNEIVSLKVELDNTKSTHGAALQREALANKSLEIKEKELNKIRSLVRDQTDADLLINALKAIGIVKEEKKTDHRAEEQRINYLRQMAGLQRQVCGSAGGFQSQGLSDNLLGQAFGGWI